MTHQDWDRVTWRLGIACVAMWGYLIVEIVRELMRR